PRGADSIHLCITLQPLGSETQLNFYFCSAISFIMPPISPVRAISSAMRILGLETSCDETGVAVYDSERGLLAHTLYSQIELHAEYGGVVPELASRDHVRKILPLINEVLAESGSTA